MASGHRSPRQAYGPSTRRSIWLPINFPRGCPKPLPPSPSHRPFTQLRVDATAEAVGALPLLSSPSGGSNSAVITDDGS